AAARQRPKDRRSRSGRAAPRAAPAACRQPARRRGTRGGEWRGSRLGSFSSPLHSWPMPIWAADATRRQKMNRARLLVFNAALGALDYRVPDGMAIAPGAIVVA